MDWSFPSEAEDFRIEVKEFIAEHLTEDVISSTHDGTIHNWDFHKKIAERGWLGGAVPSELGGGGKTALEMAVMVEELQLAGAPIDGMGVAIVVASVILELGNDHLKETIVPNTKNSPIKIKIVFSYLPKIKVIKASIIVAM